MMSAEAFAFAVAQRSVLIGLGGAALLLGFLSLFSKGSRSGGLMALGDMIARAAGATLILAIPVGFATIAGLIASFVLQTVSAPSITYLFTGFAALACFRPAMKAGGEFAGCHQILGVALAGYALVWSLVSFWMTGGGEMLGRGTLPVATTLPLLSALPFVGLIVKISGYRRTFWLLVGSLVFFALFHAVMFLPVENGFAATILPSSPWLRFPLVGAAWAALFAAIRLAAFARLKPKLRRSRRSNLRFALMFVGGMLIASGFAWAIARAALTALAGPF